MFLVGAWLLIAILNLNWVIAGPHVDCGKRGWHFYTIQSRKDLDLKVALNFTGWNYAGRAEFPWLVEIRKEPQDQFLYQDEWANGNLVTSTFVLSTCKAVATLKSRYTETLYGQTIYLHYVTKKNPKDYKVMFSEDYPYKSPGSNTGTREIRQFHVHPKCANVDFDHHWGVVEIKRPIHPNPPWIGLINIDYNLDGYDNAIKDYCATGTTTCFIGLWSRRLRSHFTVDLLWNYKIKYAVHPIEPTYCFTHRNLFPWEYRGGPRVENLECMGIHKSEKTGSICDRDRGAPIVCDGAVRAIMLAGVVDFECNRTNPMPFLVMDIKYAFDMFAELDIRAYTLSGLKQFGRKPST